MSKEKHAYCFKFPRVEREPVVGYNQHVGNIGFTQAVSPAQAVNNILYNTFHSQGKGAFEAITKYLHSSFNLSESALDLDKLDEPTVQPGLFGGKKSSHQRRDEGRLAQKISQRFGVSSEGENSTPKKIAREYVQLRRRSKLNQ